MKVRSRRDPFRASCLFTDREEPRQAFWDKYAQLKAEMPLESNVHVLVYYGIGGIGKTQLLYKLGKEMDERLKNPRHVLLNFESSQDSREALSALKNLIEREYDDKFSFPLFELGLYIHARKLGEQADSPEVKKLTDNLFLKTLMPILGFIPVVNVATSVLSAIDEVHSGIGTYLKRNRSELEQLESMEADELKQHLPVLFAQDLTHNLEDADEPLVIFLDTYERLVNELSTVGMPLENDLWIRGADGIIQNIPNVLWVIAGREKLKWELLDPEWMGVPEQHILGNLSPADSHWFLEQSGVADPVLREQLYGLTGGTPMYLDICAERYRQCVAEGEAPDISKFGSNTRKLIERFVRYMDDSQKSLIYMLAYLEKWDDKLIQSIAPAVLKTYNSISYQKAKKLSFILQSDDSGYYIHQTVGEVLRGNRDDIFDELRRETATHMIRYFSRQIEGQSPLSPGYAGALQDLMRAGLLLHQDREALRRFYEDTVMNGVGKLFSYKQYDRADAILDLLWERAGSQKGDLLYATALREWANLLYGQKREPERGDALSIEALQLYTALADEKDQGLIDAKSMRVLYLCQKKQYGQAYELCQEVLTLRRDTLGEDHPKTINNKSHLSSILFYLKQYEEAKALGEQVLEKRRALFGEDHPNTILAMSNLAIITAAIGKKEDALRLKEEALAISEQQLGADHLNTLTVRSTLADSLSNLYRYEEALGHKRYVYEKRRDILGEDHPDTITAKAQLAKILRRLRRYEEELPLRLELFEYYTQLHGEEAPLTMSARNALIDVLRYLRRYEEALRLELEGYQIRLQLHGEDHPEVAWSAGWVAKSLESLRRYEEALHYRQEAYRIYRASRGISHMDTVNARNGLCSLLERMDRYEDALAVYKDTADSYCAAFGSDDTDTMAVVKQVARLLSLLGRHEEALPLYRQLYEHGRRYYSASSPWHDEVIRQLYNTLTALGRTAEAEEFLDNSGFYAPVTPIRSLAELMEDIKAQQEAKNDPS